MTSSDSTSPILITGATGRHGSTGAHLARRLREAGQPVRALVRRWDERIAPLQALGVEIVVGDLHDRASLVPALEGVGSVYFTYPVSGGIVEAAANFAAAARQVGGKPRVVAMSVAVSHPESPSHLGRAQWLAEEVLGWAGLDLIILRIGALFCENVPTLPADPSVTRGRSATASATCASPGSAARMPPGSALRLSCTPNASRAVWSSICQAPSCSATRRSLAC